MTPAHGTQISDSGEREVSGDEHVTRDALRVAILQHESRCDLKEKVDKLRTQQARNSGALALLAVAGPVILAWWLSTRLPAPQPSKASAATTLINQAHAAPKGTP